MALYKIGITEAGDAGVDLSWVEKLDRVDAAVLITKCVSPDFFDAALEHKDRLIVHIVTYRGDDLPLLMSIRKGDYQLEDGTYRPEFFEMVSDFEKRLNYAKQNTSLPDNPDMKKVEEFVMSINRRAIDA